MPVTSIVGSPALSATYLTMSGRRPTPSGVNSMKVPIPSALASSSQGPRTSLTLHRLDPVAPDRFCTVPMMVGEAAASSLELRDLVEQVVQSVVLGLEVRLDLECLVQGGLGILIGHLTAPVGRPTEDALAHHDDRQHHQLDEGLAQPIHEGEEPTAQRLGQHHESQ